MEHSLLACAVGGWYIFCVLGVGVVVVSWPVAGRGPRAASAHMAACVVRYLVAPSPAKTYNKVYMEVKKEEENLGWVFLAQ